MRGDTVFKCCVCYGTYASMEDSRAAFVCQRPGCAWIGDAGMLVAHNATAHPAPPSRARRVRSHSRSPAPVVAPPLTVLGEIRRYAKREADGRPRISRKDQRMGLTAPRRRQRGRRSRSPATGVARSRSPLVAAASTEAAAT